ncbi:hypothetical protein FGO68_gene13567 [Halteria grandinella]|uniref:Uncharacterized protein n=1 Tax=Halteria grandinella TaxID=5974 RepID=A0A8J8NF97_HALGN|nr:hypothetical protein FGO68_gene13567 [Halteria grandinella]
MVLNKKKTNLNPKQRKETTKKMQKECQPNSKQADKTERSELLPVIKKRLSSQSVGALGTKAIPGGNSIKRPRFEEKQTNHTQDASSFWREIQAQYYRKVSLKELKAIINESLKENEERKEWLAMNKEIEIKESKKIGKAQKDISSQLLELSSSHHSKGLNGFSNSQANAKSVSSLMTQTTLTDGTLVKRSERKR